MKVIQVVTTIPTDKSYSYFADEEVQVGDYVEVEVRKKPKLGVVLSFNKIKNNKLKQITKRFEYRCKIEFIQWFAKYNLIPLGVVIKMTAPSLKSILSKTRNNEIGTDNEFDLKSLSLEQQKAFDEINLEGYSTTVLQGVTGSGKTEVYLHAADKIIKENKQVLIILPEIALSHNLLKRFQNNFKGEIAIWNSKTSISKKTKFWKQILKDEIKLIVGTRSSLLIPFPNLGLIIVDEEHDSSHKQEERSCYNARDMAVAKASIEKIPILLCSATPSIETMHNVFINKYKRLILPNRFGNAQMPEVNIIDMREQNLQPKTWISPLLKEKIFDNFAKQEQTFIFLNRRGYAPLTICKRCGNREFCINCTAYLNQHLDKDDVILICHHCNFSKLLPEFCSFCNNPQSLVPCGPGIQRIEEEIKTYSDKIRTMTLSSDDHSAKELMNKINNISECKVDVIITTQILSKGYHFPNLTLVGIIDIDTAAQNPDLKSVEQTYQMIQQVIGRAGREEKPGRVFIQTYQPEQKIIKDIINNNIDEFSKNELRGRERGKMPPFSYIATVSIMCKNLDELNKYCYQFTQNMPDKTNTIRILGPMTPYLEKIRTYYSKKILLKSTKTFEIQEYIKLWLKQNKIPKKIKIQIDMSPISIL